MLGEEKEWPFPSQNKREETLWEREIKRESRTNRRRMFCIVAEGRRL